ncbi:hypothetical protein ACFW1A_18590 [Kitasatospora sp. NPDC058965]|uniref:hypothetical protein n=1 Tax=Kitasatospora sp. NPDC058965 TaxID=3346682 RepID=UPI00369C5BC8
MTIVVEAAVACVFAWGVRKARRVGGRADAEVDAALDATMDRVHDLVVTRLGTGGEVGRLELEAAAGQPEPSALTAGNVTAALGEAVAQDPGFADRLREAVRLLEEAKRAAAPQALGAYRITVGGDVTNEARDGSLAATIVHVEGGLTLGNPQVPGPADR